MSEITTETKKSAGVERQGAVFVAITYACWGLLTIFWNLLEEVNSVYVLAQRILWSMVFMAVYMLVLRRGKELRPLFADIHSLFTCFVCGVLITINWGVYIYAINSGHVLDASLGYFIEPVLVVLLGMLAFREKPTTMEKITFLFSVTGLLYMIIVKRTFPTLSLLIAGSFAVYGAVKKKLTITPEASLFMETLCMALFALAFVIYADCRGFGGNGVLHGAQWLLLPMSGVITSIPLLLFNIGVRKIPYYVSGILMYINPTLQFLTGLLYFHEELDVHRFIAFLIIWVGILFTVYEKVQLMRMARAGEK